MKTHPNLRTAALIIHHIAFSILHLL